MPSAKGFRGETEEGRGEIRISQRERRNTFIDCIKEPTPGIRKREVTLFLFLKIKLELELELSSLCFVVVALFSDSKPFESSVLSKSLLRVLDCNLTPE